MSDAEEEPLGVADEASAAEGAEGADGAADTFEEHGGNDEPPPDQKLDEFRSDFDHQVD